MLHHLVVPHITTRYLRIYAIIKIAGRTRNRMDANLNGSGATPLVPPPKAVITNAGRVLSVNVKTEAAKTSFQDIRKAKRAEAVMPGRARGAVILRNTWSLLIPNTNPTSSRSLGILAKTLAVIKMTKGSAKAV
jgi:hypothetical protein